MKHKAMKKVLLGSATVVAAGMAGQAVAATDTLAVKATVLRPVSITATQSLHFGELTENGAGGTLTVDNTGGTGVTGGVTVIGAGAQQGIFTLKGTTGRNIKVTAPANISITSTATASKKMVVDKFTVNGVAGTINATPLSVTLGAITVTGFDLGGRLTVAAGQAFGQYVGAVTLTAVYN